MKIKLLIVFAFLSMTTVGQLTGKVTGLNISKKTSVNDTVIKVVYNNNKISNNPNPPAIFLSKKTHQLLFLIIDWLVLII